MKDYLLLVILILLSQSICIQGEKSAICFVTNKPDLEVFQFAKQLAKEVQYNLDLYIMIDLNNLTFSLSDSSSHIQWLNISNEECYTHGYSKMTSFGDNKFRVTSWDKALYYFSSLNKKYSFVWFIEDDVFIPSVEAFYSLHELYSDETDIVIPNNLINIYGNLYPPFRRSSIGRLVPPWLWSMVNVIGLSRRMLDVISDDITWRGSSTFHEFFFQTLASQSNMTIRTPVELHTLKWQQNILWEQVYKQPNNMWHPMKDSVQRYLWRQKFANINLKRKSIVSLTDVKKLYNYMDNLPYLVKYLQDLLSDFEINKSQLSAYDRRLLHQHFIKFSQQLQRQKNATEALLLIKQLADHAYKSAEPLLPPFENKTSKHIKLEQALIKNKQKIFHLLSTKAKPFLIDELRRRATSLTLELTLEIQKREKPLQNRIVGKQTFPETLKIQNISQHRLSQTYEQKSTVVLFSSLQFRKTIKQKFLRYCLMLGLFCSILLTCFMFFKNIH